ncbi:MAG: hypothetical protein JO327_07810 [Nitrososphaeraceae archaeon]|nr:hypothetical protein [Nitrososphaeraceae archaeon]MBV9668020.1 hypothetical protein [Nitrososphaeraceae archaeon]
MREEFIKKFICNKFHSLLWTLISYFNFPVFETTDIKEVSDIRNAVDRMVEAYEYLNKSANFSYRLLLPKGEKTNDKARKIGFMVQAEFLLALKKKQLKINVREIRYMHDETHYGWILANPEILGALR